MADSVSGGPSRGRRRQGGQATVETVGIIVVVAIVLAATGAFLSSGISLPRPPDLFGAITRVFGPGEQEGRRPGLDVPGAGGYVRADHGHITPETDPWLGRPIRWAGGAVKGTAVAGVRLAGTTLWLPADCAREFTAAFWDRVRERALALAVDPRELVRLIHEIGRSPEAFLPDVPNPIDGVRYVRKVFSMGLRDGALLASRDSGRAAADVAIELATRGAARVLRRAMRRRAPTAPSPRAPAPRAPRGGEAMWSPDGPAVMR